MAVSYVAVNAGITAELASILSSQANSMFNCKMLAGALGFEPRNVGTKEADALPLGDAPTTQCA